MTETPSPSTVVVLSGGLDSTVALWDTINKAGSTDNVETISFDYGQRHSVELDHAKQIAQAAGVSHLIVQVPLSTIAPTSALTGSTPVPHGHYAEDNMAATVVPNRNMVFTSLAVARARAVGASKVVLGMHAGDHPVYADCRPEFVSAIASATEAATDGAVTVEAPFVSITKAEIVARGAALNAPLELTWSCYEGGDDHCGRCGTCVERAEAFHEAGVTDPTTYTDPDFWRQVTA